MAGTPLNLRYEPPPQPEWERIATNPQMMGALVEYAEGAKTIAIGIAQESRETGQYAGSFEVRSHVIRFEGRGRGRGQRRGAADLVNLAPYAGPLEVKRKILGRTRDILKGNDRR